MQKLLSMAELQDAQAGLTFQGTGKMITPMGAQLIHVPSIEGNTIIGLDKSCALEMVQAGDILTDYDKLIDRQLERAQSAVLRVLLKFLPIPLKSLLFKKWGRRDEF